MIYIQKKTEITYISSEIGHRQSINTRDKPIRPAMAGNESFTFYYLATS